MRRGFKSESEKRSCQFRNELGLKAFEPLPARRLAQHLQIPLIRPEEIPGVTEAMLHALANGSKFWSAATFYFQQNAHIIYNDKHSTARQESDLMHELAHIICEHPPQRLLRVGIVTFREFNAAIEEEAKWFGAALQIPRDGLMRALLNRMTVEEIGRHFGASEELVRYRQNTTGALIQLQRHSRRGFGVRPWAGY